ncbi:MAG: MarR family transcriptional regulator [Pseudomonadales bacterium]|nr:MarR family transcriptional regulator [Pseudomonadales bacterium]
MNNYVDVDTHTSKADEEVCLAIFRSIMRCNHNLLKVGATVAAEYGLHLAEMNVIDMLGIHGPLKMGELSEVTFISPSNTTHTVKKLETNKYVKRKPSPDSKRAVTVCLTAKGEKIFRQSYPAILQITKKLFAENLNAAERRQVIGLLQKLIP